MTRLIDVDEEHQQLVISFPYAREVVDCVKGLPARTFDAESRSWWVPVHFLVEVVRGLEGHHFKLSERARRLWQEVEDDQGQAGKETRGPAVVPANTWSISQLNHATRQTLRERFHSPLWVVGEIQGVERSLRGRGGMLFFELLDRPVPGADPVARVPAVLFPRERQEVEGALAAAGLSLRDGMRFRMQVQVDIYGQQGRYQVQVHQVDPTYTAGELALNRDRVFKVLQGLGVSEKNRRLALPVVPLRVALIASVGSDGYNDFVHQLRSSGFSFEVAAFNARVQGAHTESSVLRGLAYFEQRAGEHDVLVIVRGGGSRSDLAFFDTEGIGRAVCDHPLKVVVGIGHQQDTCLLDLIGLSRKTPTAAGELLVRQVEAFAESVTRQAQALQDGVVEALGKAQMGLQRLGGRLERGTRGCMLRSRQEEAFLLRGLALASERHLGRKKKSIRAALTALDRAGTREVGLARRGLERAEDRISTRRLLRDVSLERGSLRLLQERLQRAVGQSLQENERELESMEELVRWVDPRRVLERGFAIVTGEQGIVRDPSEVPVGTEFRVQVAGGEIRGRRINLDDDKESDDE